MPLDDGLYDRLIEKIRIYIDIPVGAKPLELFDEKATNEIIFDRRNMVRYVKTEDMDKLYVSDLLHMQNTPVEEMPKRQMCHIVQDPIKKRMINTPHKYPELVGTLDKCKCVLNEQARTLGLLDDPNFRIFERDFIHKCMDAGVIAPNETFTMIGELKYDGVSVEAHIKGNKIISAVSRGDTADNIATDLTPILGGYVFPNIIEGDALGPHTVPKDLEFGLKFEAVITKRSLQALSIARNRSYANARNAIIGLLGASDAWRYKQYITLIPISSSLDMPRLTELAFLNQYYHSGYYNKHCVFTGDYKSILFQVKQFVEAAETVKSILPYMIDGCVFSFIDTDKILALGRSNSINKYQMAVKFIPTKVRTIFLGYTYTVGKTGSITPMAHFKPCEFIGTIHDHQTIHSYQRFKELSLKLYDEIDIEYRNEVITYVTKPDTERNRINKSPVIPFPEVCPFCGSKIIISDSGKSAKCPNEECSERKVYVYRFTKDFGF